MDKDRVAEVLTEIGTLLELQGENPFKTRAYENAARALESLAAPLEKLIAENRLGEIKGIGEGIQKKITELVTTGKLGYYDDLKASVPPGLVEMLQIPGLGPKKVKALNDKLGIESIEQLEAACQAGKIAGLDGFGEKTQNKILEGIQYKRAYASRHLLSDAEFPFALAYFPGSKQHNIVMRQRAIERGLRLNEYGLFKSKEETRDAKLRVSCKTEEEIFQKLDLAYIPPELREDKGEFAAAELDDLPRLIEWTDLKGSLHNHSNWSDGRHPLEDVASYAHNLGCAYWAITDHSKSSFVANGLDAKRLREQLGAVKKINEQFAQEGSDFRLFTGSEVDILADGKLDFPDDLLADLDVVVASVHQGFTQSEAEMTKRIIRAAQNPYVQILGHLTGRLLLEREPYKVNQHAVIDACAETGTWIELNANPYRFDLDWRLWPYARSKGVKCVINCDAHRREHAGYLRLGAGIARKGWLEKADVINTLPLKALMRALNQKRKQ